MDEVFVALHIYAFHPYKSLISFACGCGFMKM